MSRPRIDSLQSTESLVISSVELMQKVDKKGTSDLRVSLIPHPCPAGTYICLRTVTPSYRIPRVLVVAGDEGHNAVTLELYNQGTFRADHEIMDEGSVLIVKEPYLKVNTDGNYSILVDHPSDVRLIQEDDEVFPSGTPLLNLSHYRHATECYFKALQSSPTDDEVELINLDRLSVLMKTHHFDATLLYAKDASSVQD
ncbi:uncharacterized protein KD926_004713 [Aspergillus affinis]|uniref:uncharacterized protein n=1 Tax=Aspergillus affinis TaxID=1070780 RepID=UPI0022FEE7E5|nr:uncharacterized protein KD926_004713 [Aspergillus affinis]KAI9042923.1 hypothetical protein KD926_004713 [Aspergillus affinis]